ncbi:MAG TPA: gluconate 2-dehydrogenase subunit 3 family protein [Croceibacterium sp.]|nr:gluconate 2-dehydrogenase subunit 3 family protein [Croceibacterium sp.]
MTLAGAGPALDRRALMRGAILLVGGTLAAGAIAPAFAATGTERFFTPAELAIVAEYAEIVIPRTDTPGAKDAGVPEALDGLMANWASAERQAEFRALVERIAAAGVIGSGPAQVDLARRFDAAQMPADPVYRRFKELVLTLYYLSEPGATQELRYELTPGRWEPSIPVGPDTRAWAA